MIVEYFVKDKGSGGAFILQRLDPRGRIVVAVLFSVVVAVAEHFFTVAAALGGALLLALFSGLHLRKLFAGFLVMNGFIFFLWIFLPFTYAGETLLTLGPLHLSRQGLLLAALITLKSNCIMLAFISLVSSSGPVVIGHALDRLRLPAKFVYLFLFTYRYLDVFAEEYRRLLNAAVIRGFRPGADLRTCRVYAALIAMLLTRSLARAERISQAMLCRGFSGRFYSLSRFDFRRADIISTGLMLAVVLGLAYLEMA